MENLDKFENEYKEEISKNSSKNSSTNNKNLLIEVMLKEMTNRKQIPVKTARLYYSTIGSQPKTRLEYDKKIESLTNSMDTLISNYNDQSKIDNDKLLVGTTITVNKITNEYKINK